MLRWADMDKSAVDDRDLYLDLMKRALTRSAFPERYGEWVPWTPWKRRVANATNALLGRANLSVVRRVDFDEDSRALGMDWPADAETMIGLARLSNLQECVEQALEDGVPGDFIETGVWRGGACIFMRAILAAHDVTDRTVWVADSFKGLPRPDPRYPVDRGDRHSLKPELSVSLADVKRNFHRYGLLDGQVRFLEGWFEDTLSTNAIESLAVLRLDGDMYSSTIVALEALAPKVSPGGFVIVDDYTLPGARQAVLDYRAKHHTVDPILDIDGNGAYWRVAGR
jgi:O-methyltransferase